MCGGMGGRSLMIVNLEERYEERGLPSALAFRTQFDKEVFMVINLVRTEPEFIIPYVERLFGNSKEERVRQKSVRLVEELRKVGKRRPIKANGDASQACWISLQKNADKVRSHGELMGCAETEALEVDPYFKRGKRLNEFAWFKEEGTALSLILQELFDYYNAFTGGSPPSDQTILLDSLKEIGIASVNAGSGKVTMQHLYIFESMF